MEEPPKVNSIKSSSTISYKQATKVLDRFLHKQDESLIKMSEDTNIMDDTNVLSMEVVNEEILERLRSVHESLSEISRSRPNNMSHDPLAVLVPETPAVTVTQVKGSKSKSSSKSISKSTSSSKKKDKNGDASPSSKKKDKSSAKKKKKDKSAKKDKKRKSAEEGDTAKSEKKSKKKKKLKMG